MHRYFTNYSQITDPRHPVYLPPPFKIVNKAELAELIDKKEIVPCHGLHLDIKQRVDYFIVLESDLSSSK